MTAVGTASVVPDQVRAVLAVEATAPAVGDALRAASDGVARLAAVLDAAGVAATDRQTTGLQVHPGYDHATGQPSGHTATYGLSVLVRDLDAAGRLVQDAAEQVGDLLRVQGFGLSVRDAQPVEEQARRTAVQACRRSAEQVAAAAGAQLGALLQLVEGGGAQGVVEHVLRSSRASAGGGLPVEAGQGQVAVAVTGVWQLTVP